MIRNYDDVKIHVIRKTERPSSVVQTACDVTQRRLPRYITSASADLLRYLVKAEHTSVLEHASITVLIQNVSRSFLAQITRNRMCSFTAGSQHYQEYSGYDDIIEDKALNDSRYYQILGSITDMYVELVDSGYKPEEARQILPNSKAVNIMWTVNARTLLGFFRARLCFRNVAEMRNFSVALLRVCMEWWPDLFNLAGPPCITDGKCNQGKMKAQACKEEKGYRQTVHI